MEGRSVVFTITVDGRVYRNATWSCPNVLPLARKIKNYAAFYGVATIEKDEERVR